MRKDGILNSIGEHLANDNKTVICKPYSSLSIDNPDILLLTHRNSLIGLFEANVTEIQNPNILLRRLYLSRLTYIETLKTILVISEKDLSLANIRPITDAFDAVIEYQERDVFQRNIEEDIDTKTLFNKHNKSFVYNRFHSIMSYYNNNKSGFTNFDRLDFNYSNIGRSVGWDSKNSFSVLCLNHDSRCCVKRKLKSSFKDSFDNLLTYALMSLSSFDNGLVKIERVPCSMVVNSDWNIMNEEDSSYNPLYISTQALLGVLPLCYDNEAQLLKQADAFYEYVQQTRRRQR